MSEQKQQQQPRVTTTMLSTYPELKALAELRRKNLALQQTVAISLATAAAVVVAALAVIVFAIPPNNSKAYQCHPPTTTVGIQSESIIAQTSSEHPAEDSSIGTCDSGNCTEPSAKVPLTIALSLVQPLEGAPVFKWVSDMSFIWWDKGSGALIDVSVFKPNTGEGYARLGDHSWRGYMETPQWGVLVARRNAMVPEQPGVPMFKPPIGFREVWNDDENGAVTILDMVPPIGYAAIGSIAVPKHQSVEEEELKTQYVCVHESQLERQAHAMFIWWDKNSGAKDDVSFLLVRQTGLFTARREHIDRAKDVIGLKTSQLPELTPEEKAEALRAHAPQIIFHPNESWWPSSIEYMNQNSNQVKRDGKIWLTTKKDLSIKTLFDLIEDSNDEKKGTIGKDYPTPLQQEWRWLTGDQGLRGAKYNDTHAPDKAKVYSFWVEKGSGIIDLVYFVFYPFNKGKYKWGHHVGDWEHITVRCITNNFSGKSIEPKIKAFSSLYSYHSDSIITDFTKIRKAGTHFKSPVAYVAEGSHGFWLTAGHHEYKRIVGGLFGESLDDLGVGTGLYDDTGNGEVWNTWEGDSLLMYEYARARRQLPSGDLPAWFIPDSPPGIYRWGNFELNGDTKLLTSPINAIAVGTDQVNNLEDGPEGPQFKPMLARPQFYT